MTQNNAHEFIKYECQLNEALRYVVLEIRSVALLDLASFIHADKLENIADIFESAVELNFKRGTLQFSYAADLDVKWLGIPVVSLDLEFHCMEIDVFFKLEIDSYASKIKFVHATVNNRPMKDVEHAPAFSRALQYSKIDQPSSVRSFGLH
jgi:hypothetical protein